MEGAPGDADGNNPDPNTSLLCSPEIESPAFFLTGLRCNLHCTPLSVHLRCHLSIARRQSQYYNSIIGANPMTSVGPPSRENNEPLKDP